MVYVHKYLRQMYLSSLVLIVDYGRKWYHFCFNDICEPKGIIEEIIFVSNIIDHRRRMVKSIYVIKHIYQSNFVLRCL